MEGIKHVSLDLWLTLIRSNPEFKPLRTRLLINTFGINRPEEEVNLVFHRYDGLFNSINEKTGRNLTVHEMLYILLAELGVDISQIGKEIIDKFYSSYEKIFFSHPPLLLDKNIMETLQHLNGRGITVSILSNTAFVLGKTLRLLLHDFGLGKYLSFQVYSDETGFSKPSPKAFDKIIKEVNILKKVSSTEILHIGDNPIADYEGAKKAGFSALLVCPKTEILTEKLKTLLW